MNSLVAIPYTLASNLDYAIKVHGKSKGRLVTIETEDVDYLACYMVE